MTNMQLGWTWYHQKHAPKNPDSNHLSLIPYYMYLFKSKLMWLACMLSCYVVMLSAIAKIMVFAGFFLVNIVTLTYPSPQC